MKTEAYYGANIINQIITSNDFSDTTKWELFTPDLDLPTPYITQGILIDPNRDWSQEKIDSYFLEKKSQLMQVYEERKTLNSIRDGCHQINDIRRRDTLPLYLH